MTQQFYAVLTNAGDAAVAAAVANNTALNIASMAFGDGNGNPAPPNIAASGLVHEVYRTGIDSATRDLPDNPGHVIVQATIPITAGPFWVREVGLFLSDGTFFAVGNFPDTYVPSSGDGAVSSIVVKMVIVVSQTAQVTISISNSTGATQTFVTNYVNTHKTALSQLLRAPFIAVNSVTTSSPPTVKAVGDVYGIPSGASGLWAGKDGQFTQYVGLGTDYVGVDSGGWVYEEAPFRTMVGAQDSGMYFERVSGSAGPWRLLWASNQEAIDGILTDKWISPATLLAVINSRLITQPQAKKNLQIYPEVQNATGKLNVTVVSNKVVISGAQQFLWRGLFVIDTGSFSAGALQFTPPQPNYTYHLRWYGPDAPNPTGVIRFPAATYPNGGFCLESLQDLSYIPANPTPEENAVFDSTYDSMLIARVTTNASNVPTIKTLVNKHQLMQSFGDQASTFGIGTPGSVSPTGSPRVLFDTSNDNCGRCASRFITDWARTPKVAATFGTVGMSNFGSSGGYVEGGSGYIYSKIVTRYQTDIYYQTDWNASISTGNGGAMVTSGVYAEAYCDLAA
jgi:hypothetical protein